MRELVQEPHAACRMAVAYPCTQRAEVFAATRRFAPRHGGNDRRLFADRADAYKRAIELVEADLLEVFNRKEFLTKQRIALIKELSKL